MGRKRDRAAVTAEVAETSGSLGGGAVAAVCVAVAVTAGLVMVLVGTDGSPAEAPNSMLASRSSAHELAKLAQVEKDAKQALRKAKADARKATNDAAEGAALFAQGEILLHSLDRPRDAERTYEKAAAVAPFSTAVILALAEVRRSLGDQEQTLEAWQQAENAALTAGDLGAWQQAVLGRGRTLAQHMRLGEALSSFEHAMTMAGEDSEDASQSQTGMSFATEAKMRRSLTLAHSGRIIEAHSSMDRLVEQMSVQRPQQRVAIQKGFQKFRYPLNCLAAHALRREQSHNVTLSQLTVETFREAHRASNKKEMKRWPAGHPLQELEQKSWLGRESADVQQYFQRLALTDAVRRQPPTVSRNEAQADKQFAQKRCAGRGEPAVVTAATEGWVAAGDPWRWDGIGDTLKEAMSVVKMGPEAGASAGRPQLEVFQQRSQPDSIVISQVPFDTQPSLLGHFTEPTYVRGAVDIMGKLQSTGAVQSCAPYHRFVVASHRGGGVRLHRDAMGSAFWNVMLHGRKRWFLTEPWDEEAMRVMDTMDPSVNEQHDMLPDEWFLKVLPQIRNATASGALKLRYWDFEQTDGDMVIVPPGGWWHLTFAYTETTHISFNYIDEHGVEAAFREICRPAPVGKRGVVRSLRLCQNLRMLQPHWYNQTCCPQFEAEPSSNKWSRRTLVEEKMETPHWWLEEAV